MSPEFINVMQRKKIKLQSFAETIMLTVFWNSKDMKGVAITPADYANGISKIHDAIKEKRSVNLLNDILLYQNNASSDKSVIAVAVINQANIVLVEPAYRQM